jgi:polyhydroxyalkanoate synthesis regulator phasin
MPAHDQDTLDVDLDEQGQGEVENVDQDADAGDSSEGGDDQRNVAPQRKPFLEVDERTRYMTADEAKRGFSEAGKRIAALSAWEKELKEYGDLSPSDVRAYLDELIESRQTAETMRQQLGQLQKERDSSQRESGQSNSAQTRVSGEAKLTREEKDAVDWLKQQAPNLGFISKEEAMAKINELSQKAGRIEGLEQRLAQQDQRYFNSLVNEGRTKLKSWMGEDSFADDDEGSLQMFIENSMQAWINSSEQRIKRFQAGGDMMEQLLKEGYDRAKKALGLIRPATAASSYVKNKADALKRNVRKLPNHAAQPNNVRPNLGKPKKKIDSSGNRDWIGEKHNEAWEKFQSITNRNEDQ